MNSQIFIGTLICVFIILLFFVVSSKPLNLIGNLFINAIIGLSTLFSANFLLNSFNIAVGINLYTAAVSGILGFPGTLLLYALKIYTQQL